MKKYRSVIMSVLIFLLILTLTPWVSADRTDEYYKKVRENLQLFRDVYREVTSRYVDDIDPDEFMRAGIDGMLQTLDPYSVFIDEEAIDNLKIMTTGKYGGVGIVIGLKGENKVLTVISPMEGTPADRLGIRAGDQIVEIEGESTAGFDTNDAAALMRGEPGTPVSLKIKRPGIDELLEYKVIRENIIVNDVSHAQMLDDDVGYIRLARFSRKAGAEIDSAISMLKEMGMRRLVLDLRGNPGGLLEAAVEVTEMFIPKGENIVSTRGMIPEASRVINSRGNDNCVDCPVAVLVNGGSASASEIVAGAIQDHDRGIIIGTDTFGKGLVQSLVNLPYGAELKLTTAKYYTPSGRLIQKVDYFDEENPVIINRTTPAGVENDSIHYFTTNGREVTGGGGIIPDIEVENEEIPLVLTTLYRQSMFFNFANEYCKSADPVQALDDQLLIDKFEDYLIESEFDYEVEGQSELDELRKIALEKNFPEDYFKHIEEISKTLNEEKTQSIAENRDLLKKYMRIEFANRAYGVKGRFEESMQTDIQLQNALEVLNSRQDYNQTLAGK